jgi:hypothetical protein
MNMLQAQVFGVLLPTMIRYAFYLPGVSAGWARYREQPQP